MINALLGDSQATNKPDALNFEVGLLAGDAHSCEGMLSKGVEALEEALEKILSLVHDLTLALVLFILPEVHGVALAIKQLEELVNCFTTFVFMVHKEGLEVEKIEASFWESVQWVLFLLLFFNFFFFLVNLCGWLSLFLGWGRFLFFLKQIQWLNWFLCELNRSKSSNKAL